MWPAPTTATGSGLLTGAVLFPICIEGFAVFRLAEAAGAPAGLGPGDYIVPVQKGSAYAAAALGELPAAQRATLATDCAVPACRLRFPRIVLDAHTWASFYHWYHDVLRLGGFRFDHLTSSDARELAGHDLVVIPGGGGKIPDGYAEAMREFVRLGGNFVGSCFGAAQGLYPSKVSYSPKKVGASLIEADNVEVVRSFGALGGIGAITISSKAAQPATYRSLADRRLRAMSATAKRRTTATHCQTECSSDQPATRTSSGERRLSMVVIWHLPRVRPVAAESPPTPSARPFSLPGLA